MIEWYKKVVFENFANFSGRARRSEYWWFTLANLLIILILAIFAGVFFAMELEPVGIGFFVIMGLYLLATFIPNIAVIVRRMHDIDKSGWYYFVSWIPYVGGIWFLVLTCTNGTAGRNNYGLDPKMEYDELDEIGVESGY
jgi:uncharacterized membrane protein YhaH (DUF805 family)